MPRISVLLPCYNAAETLVEALESLACQTLSDFEVIAIDDGSSDATAFLLQAWAKGDPRLRLLEQPHRGIIRALNLGLSKSQGQYIARMDADDRCDPARFERQASLLDQRPEIALASCLVSGFPQDQVREGFQVYLDWQNSLITDQEIRREIFIESPFAHPSVMMRREWLVRLGGYEEHGWPEDYDLWLRMFLAGAAFAKVPEVLLMWREHPNRLTRQDSRYAVENFLRLKAHYLVQGPLQGRDAVLIWGAGMMGRRLGKQLERVGAPLAAYIDIDPRKIGRTRRGCPVVAPEALLALWQRYTHPVILAAVGARGARGLIRGRLNAFGLVEGKDWWGVA